MNLRQKLYIFSVIKKIKNPKLRSDVLKEFIQDDSFYSALKEIATNTVKGKLPLNKLQRKQLKHCKKGIYCLSRPQSKQKRKKVISNLKGGFWQYLIPVIFQLLSGINK